MCIEILRQVPRPVAFLLLRGVSVAVGIAAATLTALATLGPLATVTAAVGIVTAAEAALALFFFFALIAAVEVTLLAIIPAHTSSFVPALGIFRDT